MIDDEEDEEDDDDLVDDKNKPDKVFTVSRISNPNEPFLVF